MTLMKGLGSEHPRCDSLQNIFLVVYFMIWVLDSFILHYSTIFAGSIHVFIRVFLGIFSLFIGIYFVLNAHKVVFDKKSDKPKLIITGVFAWVRHPMYLGNLLCCLGFFFTTLSFLSLLVWIVFFVFYDKMVSYEEKASFKYLAKHTSSIKNKYQDGFPSLKKDIQ